MSITIRKLRRRAGIRFKAILRDRTGRALKSKTFTKLGLAREWAKRIEGDRELVTALGTEAARVTLADVVRGDPPGRTPLVVPKQRRWQVEWWLARLGKRHVADVRPDEAKLFLNEYANQPVRIFVRGKPARSGQPGRAAAYKATERARSPATVNRMRAMLGTIYRHAREEWSLTVQSPLQAIPMRRESNKRQVFLTRPQAEALLAAARSSTWEKLYALVLLGITTGARRGTLEAIKWSDIDFDSRTVKVARTKNSDAITLTLPPNVVDELRRHRGIGDGLVFARRGEPYRAFTSRDAWHAALRESGLTPWKPGMAVDEGFRFHDLRHSAASFLAASGASLIAIGEVLGHRSAATTRRYSHLLVEAKQRLTDEVFGGLAPAPESDLR